MGEVSSNLLSWGFKEEDWMLGILLSDSKFVHDIFSLKDYQTTKIEQYILEMLPKIEKIRKIRESSDQKFKNKVKYLEENKKNSSIQITLKDEYELKTLIEEYKLYDFIGWIHTGKNLRILKHCLHKKNKILEKLYPYVDLSIRKVIGAKVISPVSDEFGSVINNAWLAIIKYLTKIDTSKVMFSVFVSIAHRSAIFYKSLEYKKKSKTIPLSAFDLNNDENSEMYGGDIDFVDIICSNSEEMLELHPELSIDNYDEFVEYSHPSLKDLEELEEKSIDEVIEELEYSENKVLGEKLLNYCFTIVSGKVKKLCFIKIFALFFIDLLNGRIPEKLTKKYSEIMLEKFVPLSNTNPINEEDQELIFMLFRDWAKYKIEFKLIQAGFSKKEVNNDNVKNLISKEIEILSYIKNNKNILSIELLSFVVECNKNFF